MNRDWMQFPLILKFSDEIGCDNRYQTSPAQKILCRDGVSLPLILFQIKYLQLALKPLIFIAILKSIVSFISLLKRP